MLEKQGNHCIWASHTPSGDRAQLKQLSSLAPFLEQGEGALKVCACALAPRLHHRHGSTGTESYLLQRQEVVMVPDQERFTCGSRLQVARPFSLLEVLLCGLVQRGALELLRTSTPVPRTDSGSSTMNLPASLGTHPAWSTARLTASRLASAKRRRLGTLSRWT